LTQKDCLIFISIIQHLIMNILGLNAYNHDSAVSILKDGNLVFAAEEERLNRKKHSGAFN